MVTETRAAARRGTLRSLGSKIGCPCACRSSVHAPPQLLRPPRAQPPHRLLLRRRRSRRPTQASASPAQVDLDNLLANLELIHPDPWHGVSRADFVAALDELRSTIDGMSPTEQEGGA